MLSLAEIGAMQGALFAYVDRIDRAKAARAQLGIFALPGEYSRANDAIQAMVDNLARFKAKRNDLINAEPSDHEAVLAFVTDLRALAGDESVPEAMRREYASNDAGTIVGGAVADTARQIGIGIGITVPVLLLGGIIYLIATGKVKVR